MFTVVPKHKLVWCRTPKVATTTWSRIVLQLFGIKKFGHYHSQMKGTEKRFISRHSKKTYVSSLANRQRKYTGFMIARHPMERLYSAFKDKILRKGIIVNNLNGRGHTPTFSRFLTHIAMNNPTSFNRHWKPNWVLCNPCLYNYNFILKMETFDRDSGSLLRKIGAREVAEINHLNGSGKTKRKSVNFDGLLKNVKPHILEKVLNIYYLDFVLFGYDINPFLKILQNKQNSTVTIQ